MGKPEQLEKVTILVREAGFHDREARQRAIENIMQILDYGADH